MTWRSIIPGVFIGLFGAFGLTMGIVIATADPEVWPVGLGFGALGLIMLCVAAAVATAPIRYRRRERRRGERLYAWGLKNGWTYQEAPLTPEGRHHAPGTRLRLGVNRLLETTIDGMVATAAEASYVRTRISATDGTTGRANITEYVTVFALRLPSGPWPDLSVQPRGLVMRLVGKVANLARAGFQFGYRDFDERFVMQSGDPAAPRVFTQQVLDAHLAGWYGAWSLRGGELIVEHPGRLEPENVPNGIGDVRHLASLLARPAA